MNKLSALVQLLVVLATVGCAGTRTFNEYAQPGDTIALAAGWQKGFSRDDITVSITPSGGGPDIVYMPDDPAIRAVVNFYPDPVSSLLVSDRTGQNVTGFAKTYAQTIRSNFTSQERDWWQTVVFIDLPLTLPLGQTTVTVSDGSGATTQSGLEIISGPGGNPNSLSAQLVGQLHRGYLASLERSSHYEVQLTTSGALPYAVQLDLSHDPDVDSGGVGRAYAVNPVSGVKNVTWSDDGSTLRVIITPTRDGLIARDQDYKFYVAGGVENLALATVEAFDSSGAPIAGVGVNINYNPIVLDDVVP